MNQIDMRLTGISAELNMWIWFLHKMDEKGLITLLNVSDFYPNNRKGFSLQGRIYVSLRLNISSDRMD